jgi:hypothetical protein
LRAPVSAEFQFASETGRGPFNRTSRRAQLRANKFDASLHPLRRTGGSEYKNLIHQDKWHGYAPSVSDILAAR